MVKIDTFIKGKTVVLCFRGSKLSSIDICGNANQAIKHIRKWHIIKKVSNNNFETYIPSVGKAEIKLKENTYQCIRFDVTFQNNDMSLTYVILPRQYDIAINNQI